VNALERIDPLLGRPLGLAVVWTVVLVNAAVIVGAER
jgi:hypothetical protein